MTCSPKMPHIERHLNKLQQMLIGNHCWILQQKSGGPRGGVGVLRAAAQTNFDRDLALANIQELKRFLQMTENQRVCVRFSKQLLR